MSKHIRSITFIFAISVAIFAHGGMATAQPLELPLRGDSGEIILRLNSNEDNKNRYLRSAAFSPDGTRVCNVGYTGPWIVENGERVRRFAGVVELWSAETGAMIQSLDGHIDIVNSVAFSPDGTMVLTGSDDATAILWNMESGAIIHTFYHPGKVNSVAFSPDGSMVLTGGGGLSEPGTATLWDANTGLEIRTFTGLTSWVWSVAFSPDGTKAMTGSWDGAKLWDVETGAEIQSFNDAASHVDFYDAASSVAFSPDGKQVVTGGIYNSIAILWDLESGTEIRKFRHNLYDITSLPVAFSPDGLFVLTGSGESGWGVDTDNTAKLWDAESGQEIQTFHGHTSTISSVAFSPDGKQILSASYDGTARIWDISDLFPTSGIPAGLWTLY